MITNPCERWGAHSSRASLSTAARTASNLLRYGARNSRLVISKALSGTAAKRAAFVQAWSRSWSVGTMVSMSPIWSASAGVRFRPEYKSCARCGLGTANRRTRIRFRAWDGIKSNTTHQIQTCWDHDPTSSRWDRFTVLTRTGLSTPRYQIRTRGRPQSSRIWNDS